MISIDATTWIILQGLAIVGLALAVARLEFKVWKLEHPSGPPRSIRQEYEELTSEPRNMPGRPKFAPPSLEPRHDYSQGLGPEGDELREIQRQRQGFPPPRDIAAVRRSDETREYGSAIPREFKGPESVIPGRPVSGSRATDEGRPKQHRRGLRKGGRG